MVLCLYLPSGDDNEGHKYVSLLNDLNKNHPELAGTVNVNLHVQEIKHVWFHTLLSIILF